MYEGKGLVETMQNTTNTTANGTLLLTFFLLAIYLYIMMNECVKTSIVERYVGVVAIVSGKRSYSVSEYTTRCAIS